MSKTRLRANLQIRNASVYDDTLAAGATLESNPVFLEDDMNGLRSQVNKIIGLTNWYDALSGRALNGLDTDLTDLETHKVLCRTTVLTDVAVGGTDNWVVLNVGSGQAPTQVAAVLATTQGAVVAQVATNGAGFAANELDEVAGGSAIQPKNLVVVKDSTTGQALQSSGRDIYGLLQFESTGSDGDAFDDISGGSRVKISFVRQTVGLNDLEACPAADIQGKTINYSYVSRYTYDTMPEDCFLSSAGFVDQTASVDVTRQNAYDNQSTVPVELANNAFLDLGASVTWEIRDAANASLFHLSEDSAGSGTELHIHPDVDLYNNDAADNDFLNGAAFDSGGTEIRVGETAGTIESAGKLDLLSGGAANLRIAAVGGEMFLDDANQVGSTWAQTDGVKLSETQAEWDQYEAAFGGEVSLLNAIVQAFNNGGGATRNKTTGILTSNAAADANITGAGGTPNLDAQLGDYSAVNFVTDVDIYLNGDLLRNGADASANHDVYPGTTPANGDLKFEFGLEASPGNPDTITMVVWS